MELMEFTRDDTPISLLEQASVEYGEEFTTVHFNVIQSGSGILSVIYTRHKPDSSVIIYGVRTPLFISPAKIIYTRMQGSASMPLSCNLLMLMTALSIPMVLAFAISMTASNLSLIKAIIDARQPSAKVAFSTTNYHVLRSGIWTRKVELVYLCGSCRISLLLVPIAFKTRPYLEAAIMG